MTHPIRQSKWWGWGNEHKQLNMDDKPGLWPYVEKVFGIKPSPPTTPATSLDKIDLPEPQTHPKFEAQLKTFLKPEQIKQDKLERVIHAYGKSFRDVWRARNGHIERAPDWVIYPETETDIVHLVNAANTYEIALIPFGGGSNIAGCVEMKGQQKAFVSVDMKAMARVIDIDKKSAVARIQAGVLGPELEEQLQAEGFSLGHFPDSFEYSTLGGWVASRSAGMQSDKYGKIEDMVIALRMVTPQGTIETRTVPKAASGISINHMCIGSEGALGIITEVSVAVHPLPEKRAFYGVLFDDFQRGIDAIYECVRQDCMPTVMRLNDPEKTALSFACKSQPTPMAAFVSKWMKRYLRHIKGMNLDNSCFMIVGFDGHARDFYRLRRQAKRIFKQHGGAWLGNAPGRAFEKSKYDFPYMRDMIMDYNLAADVSETSTPWSNLSHLYTNTKQAIADAITATGTSPWVGCHISHNYHTGASLYFTFAYRQTMEKPLQQYLQVKKAAQDAFMQFGGTLSHHHAVGYEHAPWLEQDISPTGMLAVQGIKHALDPKDILNPRKLITPNPAFSEWGLETETKTETKTECSNTNASSSPALLED